VYEIYVSTNERAEACAMMKIEQYGVGYRPTSIFNFLIQRVSQQLVSGCPMQNFAEKHGLCGATNCELCATPTPSSSKNVIYSFDFNS